MSTEDSLIPDDDPRVLEQNIISLRLNYMLSLSSFADILYDKIRNTDSEASVTAYREMISRIRSEIESLNAKNTDGQERVAGRAGFKQHQVMPVRHM